MIDIYDRSIVDYHIGLKCEAADAIGVIRHGMLRRDLYDSKEKPIIRTGNGPQFKSILFGQDTKRLHSSLNYNTPYEVYKDNSLIKNDKQEIRI
ncbi:hypothetical protein [Clostridium tepidiprofundi]|nr:hypothetical protein [Clostridium tepidiprofundi]